MNHKNRTFLLFVASLLVFLPYAHADMVWPALYLEQRIVSWWAITIGLVTEYFFVRKLTHFPVFKSIFVTGVINLLSTLLGLILIPAVGFGWEFFPGLIIYKIFDMGTFNPLTWSATCLLAAAINTVIETFALLKFFRGNISWRRAYGWMFLANSISVGLAFLSLFIVPPRS